MGSFLALFWPRPPSDFLLLISTHYSITPSVNGKLGTLSGRLLQIANVSANGTAGTYSTDVNFYATACYIIITRPSNDNNSLTVTPIIGGYFNPQYVTIVNNKIALILSEAWGFGFVYMLS